MTELISAKLKTYNPSFLPVSIRETLIVKRGSFLTCEYKQR